MKNNLLVSLVGFAALVGAGCVTRSVIIDSPPSSSYVEPLAVTAFKVHVTANGVESTFHATQDGTPLVAATGPGITDFTLTPLPALYTQRMEHVLRVTADLKPGVSGQNWDEHRFTVAYIEIMEQPATGPSVAVAGGTTSSTTVGSARPGPGGPVIRVGTSKTFVLRVPANITSTTVATLAPVGGTIALSTLTKSFTPATRAQTVTVTGTSVGAFTINVTAPGFQPSSVSGNVVP